ncbi:hypothetical protein KY331_01745 [Candidatus Woesearchaeota archaeon]|nr:hypothetical protein [Candidatus Woesearchaeota archaeon]
MERPVFKLRGYNLACFRDYYFNHRLTDKGLSGNCERQPGERSTTEEIFQAIRRLHCDVVIVADLDDICQADCQKQTSECPVPHKVYQDEHFSKKFGFEIGKKYSAAEVMRILCLDQEW